MTNYYDNSAVSQSMLKELKKSPKHCWDKYINPDRELDQESDALRFGKAAHACIFEYDKFDGLVAIEDSFDRRTKEGKAKYNEWAALNQDKIIISTKEMQTILNMRKVLLAESIIQVILKNGEAEKEIYFNDPETGVECKLKADWLVYPCKMFPNGLILDLKTTQDASPNGFINSIVKFGYYNQQAWYSVGVRQHFESLGYQVTDYPEFVFVPIEKSSPYEFCIRFGDRQMLEIGLVENRRLLDLFIECKTKNQWPGYSKKAEYISLPSWFINKFYEGNVA